MTVNRIWNDGASTLTRVGKQLKEVLWENVRALMVQKYGAENLNRLAKEAKIGPASAMRIKESKTSIGVDIVERIARALDVQPWQLFAPGMDDEKFLEIVRVWNHTDGRGKRMLLSAAEGATTEDETARSERSNRATLR